MKILYNWLKDYLPLGMTPVKTAEVLTDIGLEVESLEEIETIPGGLKGVVTAKVIACNPHPKFRSLVIGQQWILAKVSLFLSCVVLPMWQQVRRCF